jgi:biotin operon repressor
MIRPDAIESVRRRLKQFAHQGATTKDALARELGISAREVEEAVHQLRHEGASIVAGDDGYLFTEDLAVYDRWIASMAHRASELEETLRDARATRERLARAQAKQGGLYAGVAR